MYLFTNAQIVDGSRDEAGDPTNVLVDGAAIIDMGSAVTASNAIPVDLRGSYLMPGLIDCHVHVVASLVNLGQNAALPDSLVAARALGIMQAMLARGFTTVRDVGGADIGLVLATQESPAPMPRLVISGKALSQTGGHGDYRGRFDGRQIDAGRPRLGALSRVCDGVDAVRIAAREEIKGGAAFIKVMANGGVASPTDPIHFLGFSRAELTAIVEEAQNAGTYVAAHLYTDEAIRRAVECGVLSLEHCNLISAETARMATSAGAIAIPTLVTFERLAKDGASIGLPPDSVAKIDTVRLGGIRSLEIMHGAGLPMAYGTDLLGPMHVHQSDEFILRREVLSPREIIASATSVAARLLRMEGQIGVVAPGGCADLIVVDRNPLDDIAVLADPQRHLSLIMRGGRIVEPARLHV